MWNQNQKRRSMTMDKYDKVQVDSTEVRQTQAAFKEIGKLKMLYIGAVSLLCRVYVAGDVENDDSMERLAEDFNAQGYGLEMCRAGGRSGWGIFERRQETASV
jgi:hypothetical protein